MRKSLTFALAAISALITFSAALTPLIAVGYTKAGVNIGDTAEYEVREIIHYSGTKYDTYFYYNEKGSFDGCRLHLRVINVKGTNVSLSLTLYFPNGTVSKNTIVRGNVSSSRWDFFCLPIYRELLIAPDLSVGDPIHAGSNIVINETVFKIVGNRYNLVNHAVLGGVHVRFEAYWVKSSGLLVKLYDKSCSCVVDTIWGGYTYTPEWNITMISPIKTVQMDVGSQVAALSAAGATVTVIMIFFIAADRRLRSHRS